MCNLAGRPKEFYLATIKSVVSYYIFESWDPLYYDGLERALVFLYSANSASDLLQHD
jgi:hypothetical protein